jgi:hypothetical protein
MFKLSRLLIVYAIAVPLALILGLLVSSPGVFSIGVITMLLLFLSLPLLLEWHYVLMIAFSNSVFQFVLLPGQPYFALVFTLLSFAISFLNHIMFQKKFVRAPELTRPVLLLTAVVLLTGWYRGGIGVRALGGAAYGGRNYVGVLGAIIGYFAFTARQIPIHKSGKMAGLFFLSGTTNVLPNLAYSLGPIFYVMYYFMPAGSARLQAASDIGQTDIDRISGLGPASAAALCFLLARFGIRGLFDWGKPWRFVFFCLTIGSSFFAGARSAIIMLLLIFGFQFYFERLMRTHFLPIIILFALFGFVPILAFSDRMPLSVQRAISFLPVNVDPSVTEQANSSVGWRLEMWAIVVKQVPKYLIIGKGYSLDPSELAGTVASVQAGTASDFEGSMAAGDYHSGPLSVIIPFGIFGVVAVTWLLIAGYKVLHWNYRFGDVRLRRINTLILSYYLAQVVSFLFIFGALNGTLFAFLGACGLSVSLNGGVRRRAAPRPKPVPVPQTMAMAPG